MTAAFERVPLADGGTDTYIAQDKFHHPGETVQLIRLAASSGAAAPAR